MKWGAEHDKQRKREWWRKREGETETGIEKERGTPDHAFTHLFSSFQDYQLQIVLFMLLCRSDMVHLSKTEHHPVPLTTPHCTYTQTHILHPLPLPLEKRSSSTLALLFKIQALEKKRQKRERKKTGDIRPDIKKKFDFIDVTWP